jgi:hypothetical protein
LISFFFVTRSILTTSTFFLFAFNPCYLLCFGFSIIIYFVQFLNYGYQPFLNLCKFILIIFNASLTFNKVKP